MLNYPLAIVFWEGPAIRKAARACHFSHEAGIGLNSEQCHTFRALLHAGRQWSADTVVKIAERQGSKVRKTWITWPILIQIKLDNMPSLRIFATKVVSPAPEPRSDEGRRTLPSHCLLGSSLGAAMGEGRQLTLPCCSTSSIICWSRAPASG